MEQGVDVSDSEIAVRLRSSAFRIEDADRWCVPEPFVKRELAAFGVRIPRGVVIEPEAAVSGAARALREPLALKAWGPGIVHKSELGAVRVGLTREELDSAAARMLSRLAQHRITGSRLYVEEMADAGTELLFGLIARPPFGTLAMLGIGGTLAEVVSAVAVRLCPLTRADALEMLDEFPGAALLRGHRGVPPADRDALVSAMLALAGSGGLAERLGASLAELECNPLFAASSGVVAADARLILHDTAQPSARILRKPPLQPAALFSPRSVAVVGASSSRPAWGNRTLARYRSLGWTDNLYAVHPSAKSIDGVPAYPTLGDIPGGVDYAEVSVSAEQCAGALRDARGKVKTATVNSAGFSEAGEKGRQLEAALLEAANEGGVRYLGPNCMGICSPRGRQGFSGAVLHDAGHIGAVSQSGTLTTDLIQIGTAAGLRFSAVVSAGNATSIGVGELVRCLVDDAETRTIAVHIEGGADEALVAALKQARGRKPVVLLVPGLSEAGARAAVSHTGALTSERRAWNALVAATGAALTETFEEFLACVTYLDRYALAEVDGEDEVLIMGNGGGASVLAADACEARGLRVPTLSEALQARLPDKKGGILINPLDMRLGPAGPPSGPLETLGIVLPAHPFPDVLIHLDVIAYANSTVPNRLPGLAHLAAMARSLAGSRHRARLVFVLRNLVRLPGALRDELSGLVVETRLPMFDRLSDAAAAIAAAQRFTRHHRAVAVAV